MILGRRDLDIPALFLLEGTSLMHLMQFSSPWTALS